MTNQQNNLRRQNLMVAILILAGGLGGAPALASELTCTIGNVKVILQPAEYGRPARGAVEITGPEGEVSRAAIFSEDVKRLNVIENMGSALTANVQVESAHMDLVLLYSAPSLIQLTASIRAREGHTVRLAATDFLCTYR